MRSRYALRSLVVGVAVLAMTRQTVHAQGTVVGTFQWQLQPFCNVVSITITQQGAIYTLDGFDDQCGAPQRAPLVGLATLNPDNSIGFGLNIVTAPGGRSVHVDARIGLASLSGPWTDSAGNTGSFVFGAATGGNPRPAPTIPAGVIAPGSITAAQLAPGVIGAGQINPAQVQARVSGVCANGQALRGINADGTVACTNIITTVDDPAEDVGGYISLAVGPDGNPVISHWDSTEHALRLTACGNPACTVGNVSELIDGGPGGFANDVGRYSSLAIGVDGLPIISYRDDTTSALRVTHCGNYPQCKGGASYVSTTVDDPANQVGAYSSLVIGADGLPVISHWDNTALALRVTHCGNASCSTGNTSTTVDDPTASVGSYTSIAIGNDGLPIISHHDATLDALRVTHCGNISCTNGNASTTLYESLVGTFGTHSSIAIGAGGLPVIVHNAGPFVRFMQCRNVTCTTGTTATEIRQAGAYYNSLAIGADGRPVFSSYGPGTLKVTQCGNPACTAGNTTTTVDSPAGSDVGAYSSLAIGLDGNPVIAYQDVTALRLRVAKCGTRSCQ